MKISVQQTTILRYSRNLIVANDNKNLRKVGKVYVAQRTLCWEIKLFVVEQPVIHLKTHGLTDLLSLVEMRETGYRLLTKY